MKLVIPTIARRPRRRERKGDQTGRSARKEGGQEDAEHAGPQHRLAHDREGRRPFVLPGAQQKVDSDGDRDRRDDEPARSGHGAQRLAPRDGEGPPDERQREPDRERPAPDLPSVPGPDEGDKDRRQDHVADQREEGRVDRPDEVRRGQDRDLHPHEKADPHPPGGSDPQVEERRTVALLDRITGVDRASDEEGVDDRSGRRRRVMDREHERIVRRPEERREQREHDRAVAHAVVRRHGGELRRRDYRLGRRSVGGRA